MDGYRAVTRQTVHYALGLAFAHLLTAFEVLAVMISLHGWTWDGLATFLRSDTLIITVVLVGIGTAVTALGGAWSIVGTLRWFLAGETPDARQRRIAVNLLRRQSVILLSTWAGGAVIVLMALGGGGRLTLLVSVAVMFGATASFCTGLLFTQRTLRPIIAAADLTTWESAPGVLVRLVTMWVTTSALPSAAIVVLIVCRWNGWLINRTTSMEIPVVVISLVAMFLGLRTMILVARSISDPVRDVVEAMGEIEHGRLDSMVDVYEQSEIGRLQSGFNRMVAGLKERDRLRDLFGRHVGTAVARRALEAGETLTGDVRPAAILFIDLTGSTTLAATLPPDEVAAVLNDFFRIVVAAVDEHHGLINKFQGDAALAVFGAPLRADDASSAALATARELRNQLRRLPVVDFGIGVSAGPVFAGNIGSESRYEYTVIGDPVNEAARLADAAKDTTERVLCSQAALSSADPGEQQHWAAYGSAVLRGRSEPTDMSAPLRSAG